MESCGSRALFLAGAEPRSTRRQRGPQSRGKRHRRGSLDHQCLGHHSQICSLSPLPALNSPLTPLSCFPSGNAGGWGTQGWSCLENCTFPVGLQGWSSAWRQHCPRGLTRTPIPPAQDIVGSAGPTWLLWGLRYCSSPGLWETPARADGFGEFKRILCPCSVQDRAQNQQGINRKSCPKWGLNQILLL